MESPLRLDAQLACDAVVDDDDLLNENLEDSLADVPGLDPLEDLGELGVLIGELAQLSHLGIRESGLEAHVSTCWCRNRRYRTT